VPVFSYTHGLMFCFCNYQENRKTEENRHVSFCLQLVRNVFCCDRYLASYANVVRNVCAFSYKEAHAFALFEPKLECRSVQRLSSCSMAGACEYSVKEGTWMGTHFILSWYPHQNALAARTPVPTLHNQQTTPLQNNSQTHLDLRYTILGHCLHLRH
jgi:hypothetical protein